ncbi:alpha/beta hydrolase fold domain-containing protein [Hirsutella rhossiliensis]|uniref:Alpha/beta hydrolase fold domain-containing protein n=1 Tax=Hirsutella rhossiliensis TaxID=111463 RepID=A0A9P8MQI1_9HYPO|nr:alpha/beta hydrolase fold domain-containing protein [Hirsutella rhossiliensis]KAH0958619.1 alpha/beta hydrolase fold domain-containing protein [Hirsutella rhossiliensis]
MATTSIASTPPPPQPPPSAFRRNARLLWLLLPRVPLMVRVAVRHALSLAETSAHLDVRSAVTVAVLRSLCEPDPAQSISALQRSSRRDPGVRGRIWVSTYASPPPPEDGAREALAAALGSLRAAGEDGSGSDPSFRMPDYALVEAEWTGYRAGAEPDSPPPGVSERAKYEALTGECRHPTTTVLYLHGGAYMMLDPVSHRPTTKKLAKLTGGRCYSVRYRLAPAHVFPAALLDAFVSYLTLLYPPPGAFHEPVRAEHIVVAGDSAGGNLSLALIQLLLELRRTTTRVHWHGAARTVPLPAAAACSSPWMDLTHSAPPFAADAPAAFDYLPKPATVARCPPAPCRLWPADPPRKYLYVEHAAAAAHPLASPAAAPRWHGAPPVYLCAGWELLGWETRFAAQHLVRQGVRVVYEEYEAMPHCFALVLTHTPAARRCFDSWAAFIRSAVDDPAGIQSSATGIKARSLDQYPLRFDDLADVSHAEVCRRIALKAAEGVHPAAQAKL